MINFLKKIKSNKFYEFLIRYLFIPVYNFFWVYILNFKDKLIGIIFKISLKNQEFISLKNNTKLIINDNKFFKKISFEIGQNINDDFIKKNIEKIESDKHKKEIGKNQNEALLKNTFVIDLFPELDKSTQAKIINFATSNFMLKTAYEYLGVFPIFARVYVNLNIPTKKKQSSSQLWHRDDFGYKNLDLFMAINEVNENNGPLYTIKQKDPMNIFYRVKKEVNSGLRGERGKILDQNFNYLNSNNFENLSILKGKPGTSMLIDSIRNYHKGGYCKSNYRLMLRINYMTNDSTYPIENLRLKRKEWLSLLENKNYFNCYALRKRSIFFQKLKIPQILFKLYYAISIKG